MKTITFYKVTGITFLKADDIDWEPIKPEFGRSISETKQFYMKIWGDKVQFEEREPESVLETQKRVVIKEVAKKIIKQYSGLNPSIHFNLRYNNTLRVIFELSFESEELCFDFKGDLNHVKDVKKAIESKLYQYGL